MSTVPTIELILAEMLALKAEVTLLRSEHKQSQAQFRSFLERFEAGEFAVVTAAPSGASLSDPSNASISRSPRQRGAGPPTGATVLPPIELPTRKRKAPEPAVVAPPADTHNTTSNAAPKSPAKRKIVTAEIHLDQKVEPEKAEEEEKVEAPRKRGRPRKDAVSAVGKEGAVEKDVSAAVPNRNSSRQALATPSTVTATAPLANSAATNASASTPIASSTSSSGEAVKKSVEVVSAEKGKRGRPARTAAVDYVPYDREKDPNATWHSALVPGTDIEVLSKGTWYKAKATQYVSGPNEFKLKVHFPGYGKQYDELINVLSEDGRASLRQIESE
ncbi:UNVERIFIED_CONTAM: hypothetical protein HDU68_002637 [Siphonaria sp. JEL0065]|nr:hypothetical protein HDU68_002637 [Siphonaria sp. JEL0065]